MERWRIGMFIAGLGMVALIVVTACLIAMSKQADGTTKAVAMGILVFVVRILLPWLRSAFDLGRRH